MSVALGNSQTRWIDSLCKKLPLRDAALTNVLYKSFSLRIINRIWYSADCGPRDGNISQSVRPPTLVVARYSLPPKDRAGQPTVASDVSPAATSPRFYKDSHSKSSSCLLVANAALLQLYPRQGVRVSASCSSRSTAAAGGGGSSTSAWPPAGPLLCHPVRADMHICLLVLCALPLTTAKAAQQEWCGSCRLVRSRVGAAKSDARIWAYCGPSHSQPDH